MSKKLICVPLQACHIEIAAVMAQENYDRERKSVTALRDFDNRRFYRPQIENLVRSGVGRIALQDGEPVGFLGFGRIEDISKTGIKGAISPIYGYGIRSDNRGEVIGKLFESIAAELCERYVQNLRVSLYAHDTDVLKTFIMSAFSMEVTDVIRDTDVEIPYMAENKFQLEEISKSKLFDYRADVIELYRGLINHLRMSPIFYHCKYFLPVEKRFEDFLSDDMRVFVAFDRGQLVGMIDSEPADIDFARDDLRSSGMGDVFIKPNYRGCGLGQVLLNFANNRLKNSGVKRIYVTHGTINPTARGFWDKYFANYSYTMTRSIDPSMLGVIEPV